MYVIRNLTNKSIVMDIYNADTRSGANLQTWTDNGGLAQHFQLRHVGGGKYRIENQNSGIGFNAYNNGTANGTNVMQWPYMGQSNEKWYFRDAGNGSYYIVGEQSGKAITFDGTYTDNPKQGLNLGLWEIYGGNNQKYVLDKISSSLYNGTTLYAQWEKDTYTVSYDAKGGTNKKADLNGDYTFSFGDGKYLKDENGFVGGNASVGEKDETSQWTLEKSSVNGYYYIANKATGNVLYIDSNSVVKVGPQKKGSDNTEYLWTLYDGGGTCEISNYKNDKIIAHVDGDSKLYCDVDDSMEGTDYESLFTMTASGSKTDYPDRIKAGQQQPLRE